MAAGNGMHGTCLHLVMKPDAAVLAICASQFRNGDSVLLLDSGVMALAGPQPVAKPFAPVEVFLAEADAAARGLLDLARSEGLRLLPDEQFADLLARHQFCLSWK